MSTRYSPCEIALLAVDRDARKVVTDRGELPFRALIEADGETWVVVQVNGSFMPLCISLFEREHPLH